MIHTHTDAVMLARTIWHWSDAYEVCVSESNELERLLHEWDEPGFSGQIDHAKVLLGHIDDTLTPLMDMMDLGELRVPIEALDWALRRKRHSCTGPSSTDPASV